MKIKYYTNEFDTILITYLDNMFSCVYEIKDYLRGVVKYDQKYEKYRITDMLDEVNYDFLMSSFNEPSNGDKIKVILKLNEQYAMRFHMRHHIFNMLLFIHEYINEHDENMTINDAYTFQDKFFEQLY